MERLLGNKRKTKNGTLLHIWLRSRDTFTQLGEASGTLLHIWKKQSGHFYTSGRSKRDTFTHLQEASGTLLHICGGIKPSFKDGFTQLMEIL